MKEQLIDFETAKLAKELGFDEPVYEAYYATKNELSEVIKRECWSGCIVNSYDEAYLAAPTQSLLQKWLRDDYDIRVLVEIGSHDFTYFIYSYGKRIFLESEVDNIFRLKHEFNGTYEEALEVGLKEALQILKTK